MVTLLSLYVLATAAMLLLSLTSVINYRALVTAAAETGQSMSRDFKSGIPEFRADLKIVASDIRSAVTCVAAGVTAAGDSLFGYSLPEPLALAHIAAADLDTTYIDGAYEIAGNGSMSITWLTESQVRNMLAFGQLIRPAAYRFTVGAEVSA
jgi:hypothetical protein